MKKSIFLTAHFLLLFCMGFAQTSKLVIPAVRASVPVKIDGELNDEAWKSSPAVLNFIEQRPVFGRKENENSKTEAYILYDDNAVYIAAFCHEVSRDSISTELTGRDKIGINDFAGVMFDTYMDGINGVGFYVTALGEQYDCKYSFAVEDGKWSTVYQTAAKITDTGWSFEMKIPYSALRFSKQYVQSWGINFVRSRTKSGQQFMWSPVDPNRIGVLNQAGKWSNIEDIKPPIRLTFSPYFSSYVNYYEPNVKKLQTSLNGGMDVKYGINEAFTLDLTLIPDFGQVQSDKQVLNLSPFEVRYNENRSFFTEGTELFNKGNLFYSRRIGGIPINYAIPYTNIGSNETLVKNPAETKLLNATKISGRFKNGLGIGFFNAMTKQQYAIIEDSAKQRYKIQTSPFINYNILVLDKSLKNNSSLSLVNTSVLRSNDYYDANVTAIVWNLYDKKMNWNLSGKIVESYLFGFTEPSKNSSGMNYNISLGKVRGAFNFELRRNAVDDKYYQNDLGFFTNNNYIDHGINFSYKWTRPKGFYNTLRVNFSSIYSQRYIPRSYQYVSHGFNINSQLKNLWFLRFSFNLTPQQQDFYESRIKNKMFKTPASSFTGFSFTTNTTKKYSASFQIYKIFSPKYRANGTEISLTNQYRFNNKLAITLTDFVKVAHNYSSFAFLNSMGDSAIFGLSNQNLVENNLDIKYNFNTKMGFTLHTRHYWNRRNFTRFFNLKNNGYLEDISSVNKNPNNNANFFNIEMIYTWQFASGSFINIGLKSNTQMIDKNITNGYFSNLNNIINIQKQSILSFKVIYYLDYLKLKK